MDHEDLNSESLETHPEDQKSSLSSRSSTNQDLLFDSQLGISDITTNSTGKHTGTVDAMPHCSKDVLLDTSDAADNKFWCHICNSYLPQACAAHGPVKLVEDNPLPSRAEASLPSGLYLRRGDSSRTKGIIAKRYYAANTMFGPFIAPLFDSLDSSTADFPLPIETKSGSVQYLLPMDEERCNWMMFIQPANCVSEQNVAVVEQNYSLYLVTTQAIVYNQELKFGYSEPYAKRHGLLDRQLLVAKQPEGSVREKMKCEYCDREFKYALPMKRHVLKCQEKQQKTVPEAADSCEVKTESSVVVGTCLAMDSKTGGDVRLSSVVSKLSRRVPCPVCSVAFDQIELMQLHLRSHDKVHASDSDNDINGGEETHTDSTSDVVTHGNRCPACSKDEHSKRVSKAKLANVLTFDHQDGSADEMDMSLPSLTSHKPRAAKKPLASGYVMSTEVVDDEVSKTSEFFCQACNRYFLTASALACHERSHQRSEYYGCFLCDTAFSCTRDVEAHVTSHAIEGLYYCPECPQKSFESWRKCRKHVQTVHTGKQLECEYCDKVFSRPDKLRIHKLMHTKTKEYMCHVCGRQFTRKDKLQDHLRKVHSGEELNEDQSNKPASTKFKPTVCPKDFHRFVYKCLDCSLGFKRRGMLINHLVRCHPNVPVSSVPELNLPLLRTQKEYYCLHCSRVYKSSSKRKAHMIKCHPDSELPENSRLQNDPQLCAYTNTVGSVTALPFSCEHCHKQYASKCKLVAHQRDKHPDLLLITEAHQDDDMSLSSKTNTSMEVGGNDVLAIMQPVGENENGPMSFTLQAINIQDGMRVDNSEFLTQALSMHELHPTFEFHNQPIQLMQSNQPQQTNHSMPPTSVEFRLVPNFDLSNFQVAGMNTSGLTLTVPVSSMSPSHHAGAAVVSAAVTASSNIDNRNSIVWPQFRSPLQ